MEPNPPSICEEAMFAKIFREYAQTLHNYLFYKSGNETLAQDLTQEAFARLWKNCAKVVFHTAKGYVFKIANNLLLNEYEHQKVVLKFQQHKSTYQTEEHPGFLLEEQELKQALEAAIAALPEKQRVVFLMSRIEKMTYQEIADTLEISRQAVEKRIYKALDALREVVSGLK